MSGRVPAVPSDAALGVALNRRAEEGSVLSNKTWQTGAVYSNWMREQADQERTLDAPKE